MDLKNQQITVLCGITNKIYDFVKWRKLFFGYDTKTYNDDI